MRSMTVLALATFAVALLNGWESWRLYGAPGCDPGLWARSALDILLVLLAIGCSTTILSLRSESRARRLAEDELRDELARRYGVELEQIGVRTISAFPAEGSDKHAWRAQRGSIG